MAKTAQKPDRITAAMGPARVDKNGQTRCRVCGCTETDPCAPACAWTPSDPRGDLCSVCKAARDQLRFWFEDARRPAIGRLLREVRHRA